MFTINFNFNCVYCGSKIERSLDSSYFYKKNLMHEFIAGDLTEYAFFGGLEFDNCVRITCKNCFAFHSIDVGAFSFNACEGISGYISEFPFEAKGA